MAIDAISAARSGMSAAIQHVAATGHNLANMRTATGTDEPAFRGERVVLEDRPKGGVGVAGIGPAGTDEGVVVPEPTHPDSDAAGNVRYPNIDVAGELVNLQLAQRQVEANVVTIERAFDAYRDLLAMTNTDRERLASTSA